MRDEASIRRIKLDCLSGWGHASVSLELLLTTHLCLKTIGGKVATAQVCKSSICA
jgi:hypothetical protein